MTGTPEGGHRKKLIEVSLPLDAINRESAREKSIRHGHPSTLHLWWARRPLAAARAVLFAQLVDDPSSRTDEFPTTEEQDAERRRLFGIIEELVKWENIHETGLYKRAYKEILKSTDGNPPPILDPFAGGGTIPLEAQRLGLEAHASDLNPVAVLINKALIEIPPKWAGQPPVFPGAADQRTDWPGATGLAEDVRRYGKWMRDEAEKRIGHLYPKAKLEDGTEANVIAWLWARTVTCPNPACGATMPLMTTFWLSKKKSHPTWLEPVVEGNSVRFEVVEGNLKEKQGPQPPPKQGRGAKFSCLVCGDVAQDLYVRKEGSENRLGSQLLGVVAESNRKRKYLPVKDDGEQIKIQASEVSMEEEVPTNPRWFSPPAYGLKRFADLFTPRQLSTLTVFSSLVGEAQELIELHSKNRFSAEYASHVALYLAFCVDKFVDRNSALCVWENGMDRLRGTFQRQALPMSWDYAEANPFGGAGGDFSVVTKSEVEAIEKFPQNEIMHQGFSFQGDARSQTYGSAIATDPPYYDNIGYADLSDFFYVWLRRSLGGSYQDVLGTVLSPKNSELIATPYRFEGNKRAAEENFEKGFDETFSNIRKSQPSGIPLTLFYAFKQAENEDSGVASTGWETMLEGLIQSGLTVTATWPMRTELKTRSVSSGTNALASSVVLSCRPRPDDAGSINKRDFIAELRDELPAALRDLQQGSIPPVDMAQAAIGPGMAVFSRYSRVEEPNGTPMRVREALRLINQILDEVLSEQEGDFDGTTRWCLDWFKSYGFDQYDFGTAETLSRAKNVSVEGLTRAGVIESGGGKVTLLPPAKLPAGYDPATDDRVSEWETVLHLAKRLEEQGGKSAARLMVVADANGVDLESAKELAYLLYSIAEQRGWAQHALLFNSLGTSWNELEGLAQSPEIRTSAPVQEELAYPGADEE